MDCKPKTLEEACETIRNYIGSNPETVRLLEGVGDARAKYELALHQVFGFEVPSGVWEERVRGAAAAREVSEQCWRDCDITGVHDALIRTKHEWLMAAALVRDASKQADAMLTKELV